MVTIAELLKKKASHLETGLTDAEIAAHLAAVDGWRVEQGQIVRNFGFLNYYDTLAFVNAIAYVIHLNDHHPELVVTYKNCVVKFNTHSVNGGRGGISESDFILAAKIDAIYREAA